ncbi:MAG: methyltransferase [Croceibacterium sp.]
MRATFAALALGTAVLTGCVTSDEHRGRNTVAEGLAVIEAHDAIMAAIADPLRPAADTARDVNRKPMDTVMFAGVKPGAVVAELAPGGGYYTRILARAVGPNGHVYALVPAAFAQRPGGLDALNALAAQYGNVTVMAADYTALSLPRPADVAWTSENWHDFHNGPTANPAGIARGVYAALRPGGLFYIEDHAAPGTGATATSTLHRIDPALVITELTAAGFKLDGQSSVLANPNDPHSARSNDPAIRGETDKFALRFRKPG